MSGGKLAIKKRMRFVSSVFMLLGLVLIVRLGWVQLVRGSYYKAEAMNQQTRDQKIASKRGNIYDRNMNVLATSGSAERIYINPRIIKSADDSSEKNAEAKAEKARKDGADPAPVERNVLRKKVIAALTEILGTDEQWLNEQLDKTDRASIEVKANVEKETADKLRKLNLTGIEFTEDAKRYYPNGSLLCHVLGFTGKDGQGLEGLENILDAQLSGTAGRVRSAKSAKNGEMPFKYETYEAASDGGGVILTIDKTIQQFVEKHLNTAYEENKLNNGAAAIVMNPKTAEILAMAVAPGYDLSDYNTIKDETLLRQVGETLEKRTEEYQAAQSRIAAGEPEKGDEDLTEPTEASAYNEVLLKMRRNKAVVDSYEPGSTFKAVVAAAALEENVVSLSDTFNCPGYRVVAGTRIKCAKEEGHGTQTFVQGVMNSCNPVFMDVGARLGAETFDKYFEAFGLKDKTGFLIPGESEGTHHEVKDMGPVELATSSFGQTFTVTPLQMVCAISAVVNGGYLMEPHIVKSYTDSEGNIVENVDPVTVRRVISEETSATMREILEKVVSEGGGKAAYIPGYRIGGKTGTSEKLPRGSNLVVASFVGFAPADDPDIVCLVILDEPMNGMTYGGQIAAPVAGAIISDTLKYLGYEPNYTDDDALEAEIIVPDVTGESVDEARERIAGLGLKATVKGEGDTVIKQIPKEDARLHNGSVVILYTEDEAADEGPPPENTDEDNEEKEE